MLEKFVKRTTSENIWSKHVLIGIDNPYPISQFCKDELGSTIFLKMISDLDLRSVGPPAITFPLSGHPPFVFSLHIFSLCHEDVC